VAGGKAWVGSNGGKHRAGERNNTNQRHGGVRVTEQRQAVQNIVVGKQNAPEKGKGLGRIMPGGGGERRLEAR